MDTVHAIFLFTGYALLRRAGLCRRSGRSGRPWVVVLEDIHAPACTRVNGVLRPLTDPHSPCACAPGSIVTSIHRLSISLRRRVGESRAVALLRGCVSAFMNRRDVAA